MAPKSNIIVARYKFHNKVQGESETFEQFITALRMLAKDCGFPDKDDMICDRIIFGTKSPKVREKVINAASSLMLEKAAHFAGTRELSQAQLKPMGEKGADTQVHAVGKNNTRTSSVDSHHSSPSSSNTHSSISKPMMVHAHMLVEARTVGAAASHSTSMEYVQLWDKYVGSES